jgi:CRP-like cAMP-binding protein/tRNA A-37 threonylcarbamoyl transferase component Bud32
MSAGTPPPQDLEPGTRFGRYLIVRRIGSGGMATVYEAKQTDIDKRVAVKALHAYLANRLDVVKRFVLEARAASRIEHPHVVGVTDIGVEQGVPFMAMELLEGEDLVATLHREGPLPVERITDLLLPVISAVAAAHDKGILHRDIKPENVFLARRLPRGEHPVLLDFGISKLQDGSVQTLTAAGELLGTPPYMAPEQVLFGMKKLDARGDQYALGVVLYEAVTGALPFPADGPTQVLMVLIARGGAKPASARRPGLPPAFDAVVMRAMSVSRDDRFPSVRDLGRALLPFASPFQQATWEREFGGPAPEVAAPDVASGATQPAMAAVARPPSAAPVAVSSDPARRARPADLRAIACLAECSDADLDAFAAFAPPSFLKAGEPLFEEGAAGDSLFLLLTGDVEIRKVTPAGQRVRIHVKPGALLGAMSLGDGGVRTASATAFSDAMAIELPRVLFDRLSARLPFVAARLLGQLAVDATRRLRAATVRFTAVTSGRRDIRDKARTAELAQLAVAVAEWSVGLAEAGVPSKRPGRSDV